MNDKVKQPEDTPNELAELRRPPPSPALRDRVLTAARHEWAAAPQKHFCFPAPVQLLAAAAAALLMVGAAHDMAAATLAPWQSERPLPDLFDQVQTAASSIADPRLARALAEAAARQPVDITPISDRFIMLN